MNEMYFYFVTEPASVQYPERNLAKIQNGHVI